MPAHYQQGIQNSVAFVFSCPGRHEQEAKRPAARVTGTNLSRLLTILAKRLDRTDLDRDSITIANAWDRVEYRELTGRSEATPAEVRTVENINRLQNELAHVTEFIVFCGDNARVAADELNAREWPGVVRPCFLFTRHLGLQGLLAIARDVDGKQIVPADDQIAKGPKDSKREIQNENTVKRLKVVARDLLAQLPK
jgi:hypothetical protein